MYDNWYENFISDTIFDNIEYYLKKNNLKIIRNSDFIDIAIILKINHEHDVYSDYIMIPRIIKDLAIEVKQVR